MSKLNCRIGDLAIVVRADLPQNDGHIVEVVGPQTDKRGLVTFGNVRTASGREGLFYRFNDTGLIAQHAEGPAPDCCLRAIAGLDDADTALEDLGVGSTYHAPIAPEIQTTLDAPTVARHSTAIGEPLRDITVRKRDHFSDIPRLLVATQVSIARLASMAEGAHP